MNISPYRSDRTLEVAGTGDVLVTGGGAFNTFLIEKIQSKTRSRLIIPDDQIVKFKEALDFRISWLAAFPERNQLSGFCYRVLLVILLPE